MPPSAPSALLGGRRKFANKIEFTTNDRMYKEISNDFHYGLNTFRCESIIKYKGKIWTFVWFKHNSEDAVYFNSEGESFVLRGKPDGVVQMQ